MNAVSLKRDPLVVADRLGQQTAEKYSNDLGRTIAIAVQNPRSFPQVLNCQS
jgi:hypothetical protein